MATKKLGEIPAALPSVEITNAFPARSGKAIAGICTFYFKNVDSEAADGRNTIDLKDARVPSGSVLIFQARKLGCVSAFRVRVLIADRDGVVQEKLINRADRPGRCWSRAKYDCGDE